jgi:hypothetical protein
MPNTSLQLRAEIYLQIDSATISGLPSAAAWCLRAAERKTPATTTGYRGD